MSKAHGDNANMVEEPLHGSNLIMGGTLGEESHQVYNEGDGKNMNVLEIIFLCDLIRLPPYLVV